MNVVAHNLLAMNAQRQFGINAGSKAKSTEKLSSGYKINRAADDAAGLSISEKMRRQIRGLSQGVANTQDGVSLCQVADGALAEVNEMLHRITELSVKAANGTNSEQDRQYIQEEIQEILAEIDRVGETTTFNERPVFKGHDRVILDSDGSSVNMGDVEFSDLQLADVNLGKTPLVDGENADMLHLQAIVSNENSAMNGQTFNLIFGNGSTSSSSVRITDGADNQMTVKLEEFATGDFSTNGTNEWSREFTYSSGTGVEIGLKQTVRIEDTSDTEKNYAISYEFKDATNVKNLEFMFHADTAYNNNDTCEGYFIGGTRVDKYCVYSQNGSQLTSNATSDYVYNGSIPDSLSVIDVDNALAFSEKISFGSQKPDSLSIGNYGQIHDWSYYNTLDGRLGVNAERTDLGFSLYYNLGDMTQNSSVSFSYGIANMETDSNLSNVTVKPDTSVVSTHEEKWSVWIQSGAEAGDGMHVIIDEMNTEILGIDKLDVSTADGATRAIDEVAGALKKVTANRSRIGAQQNRMEHTIANEENVVENTTAAESRIRDTDMAREMVRFSNLNILSQAGQAMMAQANQSNQGVLNLLG